MNLQPRIPLYVSGFGPRAMALAGEYGDGLIFAIPPRGVPVQEALGHARQGAARGGRDMTGFRNASLLNVVLLEPGERADSDRVKQAVGPNIMASVYYFYDTVHERGIDPPPFLSRIWKPYCALVEETPPEHRHFRTHEFHYHGLHPGEADADRRATDPRNLPGRHGRRTDRADPPDGSGRAGGDDHRHRHQREMAVCRGVLPNGDGAAVALGLSRTGRSCRRMPSPNRRPPWTRQASKLAWPHNRLISWPNASPVAPAPRSVRCPRPPASRADPKTLTEGILTLLRGGMRCGRRALGQRLLRQRALHPGLRVRRQSAA